MVWEWCCGPKSHQHVPFRITNVIIPPLLCILFLWKRIISGGHSPEACPCPGVTSPCTTYTPTIITPQKCIKCWKAKNCIRVHKSKQMLCPSTSLVWCFSPEIISMHRVPHTKHSRMLSSFIINLPLGRNPIIAFPTRVLSQRECSWYDLFESMFWSKSHKSFLPQTQTLWSHFESIKSTKKMMKHSVTSFNLDYISLYKSIFLI